jgi:hypothetical protein
MGVPTGGGGWGGRVREEVRNLESGERGRGGGSVHIDHMVRGRSYKRSYYSCVWLWLVRLGTYLQVELPDALNGVAHVRRGKAGFG